MVVAPLFLGFVGAGLGYLMFGAATFLGLSAAAWGWMVGSMIGNMLFQPKLPAVEGPRVTDFYIPQNDYGTPIPIIYGTARIQCPVIWMTDIKEVKRTRTVGGGKGGGGGQKVTTYDYYATFACLICEGEIEEVVRIWGDGNVIFDARVHEIGKEYVASADVQWMLTSGGLMAKALGQLYQQTGSAADFKRITVYYGNEYQEPSEIIESYEGVGNVSAYRGLAYIVIEDLHLKNFGNRIPNISVEVLRSTNSIPVPYDIRDVDESIFHCDLDYRFVWYDRGLYKLICSRDAVYSGSGNYYNVPVITIGDDLTTKVDSEVLVVQSDAGGTNLDIRAYISDLPASFVYLYDNYVWNGYASEQVGVVINKEFVGPISLNGASLSAARSVAYDEDNLYFIAYGSYGGISNQYMLKKASVGKTVVADQNYDPLVPANSYLLLDREDKAKLYLINGTEVRLYDTQTLSLIQTWTLPESASGGACIIGGLLYYLDQGGNPSHLGIAELNDDGTVTVVGGDNRNGFYQLFPTLDYQGLVLSDHATSSPGPYPKLVYFGKFSSINSPSIGSIVDDVLSRVNLPTTAYDSSALYTTYAYGVAIRKPIQARQIIESLMRVFFFDMAEEDGKLVAKRRDSAPYTTIDISVDGEATVYSTPPKENEVLLGNELELPKKVSLIYMDKDRDYNLGEQSASREASSVIAKGTEMTNFPVVMSASDAAKAADTFLYEIWHNRRNYSFTLSSKWMELSPGDTVNIKLDNGEIRTVRIIKVTTDGGMVSVEALEHNPNIYTSGKVGWTNTFDNAGPGVLPYTAIELMDIPILRDVDDNAGFYLAVAPLYIATNWEGAAIFRSVDGSSFSELTRAYTGAAIGRTTTALPEGPTTVWDESSTVTIRLYNGTLTSATESQVLNGANAFLIGNEIVQFVNAVQNADGTYTISKLLRGRKGTEWAVGAHSSGERVVKLVEDGSVIRINTGESDLNKSYVYKAVTIGDTLEETASKTFTNTGVGLKPLSPVHLSETKKGTDTWDISWIRRTRIGGEWNDYSDVPLGEASEEYTVEHIRAGSIITTNVSTSASYTITGANVGDEIRISQNSSTVGAGYASSIRLTRGFDNYDDVVLEDSPVLYLRLAENVGSSSCIDYSGNNITGTYSGVTLEQSGLIQSPDTAAQFAYSSSSQISFPADPRIDFTGDLSVEFWIKISSTQTTPNQWPKILWKIAGNVANGNANYLFYLDKADQKLYFRVSQGAAGNYQIGTSFAIFNDQIYHVVGVFKNLRDYELYINGVLDSSATGPYTGILSDPNQPLYIGETVGDISGGSFDGILDEVAVYNYALTPTQIMKHYRAGKRA